MLSHRSKFNVSPDQSPFLKNFHALLLERLCMIQDGNYSKEKMDRAIANVTRTKSTSMRMDLDPIQLSIDLEPKLYWLIQETARKVTGDLMPMDELVRMLLMYFVRFYTVFEKDQTPLPFIPANARKRTARLDLFKVRFGKYFKNHIPDLQGSLDAGRVSL